MQGIFEAIFDIIYLSTMILLGIRMVMGSKGIQLFKLYGWMAIVLGVGDAFHLIPRIMALNCAELTDYTPLLGIGKLVTSITMTFFYVLLYYVWKARYGSEEKSITYWVWGLSCMRVVIALLPQNRWMYPNPPLLWGIYRNIPFTLLGMLLIYLFMHKVKENDDQAFKNLALTLILSFGFYLPVVLFSTVYPMVGILMIPKTMAYVWTILIGYNTMKRSVG